MSKVEMEKAIYLQMWTVFDIWSGNIFAIWIGQIQLKLHYELVSRVGKLQLHKLVAIEFAPSNGKKNTFANEYFLPFHDRRNGFIL